MVFPPLSVTPSQSWLPWTVPCHSEATLRKANRASAWDTGSPAFCRAPCQASNQQLHQDPYFWLQSDFWLRIPWNMFHAYWCRLTENSKICTHGRTLCLSCFTWNEHCLYWLYETNITWYNIWRLLLLLYIPWQSDLSPVSDSPDDIVPPHTPMGSSTIKFPEIEIWGLPLVLWQLS